MSAGLAFCMVPFAFALPYVRAADEHVVFDERGLRLISPEMEMRVPWSAVRRISAHHGLVLFWNGRGSFIFAPRRAFSDAQWSTVQGLAAEGSPATVPDLASARSPLRAAASPVRPRRAYPRRNGRPE